VAARPVIDGGMAAAIRDQQTRRRTPIPHPCPNPAWNGAPG